MTVIKVDCLVKLETVFGSVKCLHSCGFKKGRSRKFPGIEVGEDRICTIEEDIARVD